MTNNRATKAMMLKAKNEAFFQSYHPHIYKVIKNNTFEHLTLNIDEITGKSDVFYDKESIYNGDMDDCIDKEIAQYKLNYSKGTTITTIAPPTKHSFPYYRYFSNRMRELIEQNPDETDNSNTYEIPEYYPLIFFMGCWSGLHIQKFLTENTVLKAIIFEPNPENFLLSLYITDWKELFEHAKKHDNEISITIGSSKLIDVSSVSNNVWNMFVNQCPSFPLMSLFYNHLGDTSFLPIINKVRNDMHIYLNQWGYYDDEVNQLNNAFHNIAAGIPALPQDKSIKDQDVFIIGAGPSLDSKIEYIKKHSDNAIIVSCGSGLRPLVKNGIIPDYHIEIESHMLTHEVLNRPEYKEIYKKTVLIAALQLPPNVFNLFENKYFFIKDSSALSELFTEESTDIISGATPTCTNAGFAVFSHLNYKNIFLFGLDFGFIDKDKHHSKSSIYYEEGNSDTFTNIVSNTFNSTISVMSVYDKPMLSVPMYNTSRRSLENCISNRCQDNIINIYNCSEGAKIQGTTHVKSNDINSTITKNSHGRLLLKLEESLTYSNELPNKISDIQHSLLDMCNEIIKIIDSYKEIKGLDNSFRMSHKINNKLLFTLQNKHGGRYFLLRGTIWHILHSGMSVALSIKDNKLKDEFLSNWKHTFRELMINLPKHFKSISQKEYPNKNDPWIHEDIAGNENNFIE